MSARDSSESTDRSVIPGVVRSGMDELQALREVVCALHGELVRWGLVTWTSGNISARVPGEDLMVIKPSGIAYEDLTPDLMVVTDLDGRPVGEGLAPSSDTFSHAFI
jgi:L-ribulose-5-phosphate 4-epimerase